MMKMYNQGNIDQYPAILLSRCKRICNSERFLLHKYIFDNKYETQKKHYVFKYFLHDWSIVSFIPNFIHGSHLCIFQLIWENTRRQNEFIIIVSHCDLLLLISFNISAIMSCATKYWNVFTNNITNNIYLKSNIHKSSIDYKS